MLCECGTMWAQWWFHLVRNIDKLVFEPDKFFLPHPINPYGLLGVCRVGKEGENVEYISSRGDWMYRNTKITLGLSILFSVYMLYLFLCWATLSKAFPEYYVFPFLRVSQLSVFQYWVNFVALISLVAWVVWFLQLIRETKWHPLVIILWWVITVHLRMIVDCGYISMLLDPLLLVELILWFIHWIRLGQFRKVYRRQATEIWEQTPI